MASGTLTPTLAMYQAFQTAYDHFNKTLFAGELPACLITLQRHNRRTYGYFSPARFQNIEHQEDKTDEIAMNPQHFLDQPAEKILSTLVHEMVHLWQAHFGKSSRSSYHNRQWADKMKEVGLHPSNTGEPGGKETGQGMSHYIIPDGAFVAAGRSLIANGFSIAWGEFLKEIAKLPPGDVDDEDDDRSNRVKYSCPACHANIWAKPSLSAICGVCTVPFAAVK